MSSDKKTVRRNSKRQNNIVKQNSGVNMIKKQTIYIPKSALKPEHGVYYTILGDLKTYEKFPEPEGDCRLTYQSL